MTGPTVLTVAVPDRSTFVLLIGLVLLVASGAMREFVWSDLRAGMLRFDGLSRSTRILVFVVLLFLTVLTVGLVFHDFWRQTFDLSATRRGTPGRGTLVSQPLLPVTLFLIGLATAVALTGALHVRKSGRVLAVVLYLGIAGQWAFVARGIGAGEPWQRTAILWGLGAVPVFFALRWRAKERPLLEFCVLFVIISMMLGLCQELLLEADRQFGGVSLAASQAVVVIAGLGVFAIPFLFFIGLDIAEFGLRASGWTAQIARSKLGPFARWAPLALLIALVGQRGHTVIVQLQDHLANDPGDTAWKRYVGAAGVVVVILIAWWVIAHRSDSPEIHPERVATAGRSVGSLLVFIFLFPTLLSQLLVELSLVLDTAGLPGGGAHTTANALDFSGWTSDTVAHWLAIVGVGAMAFAWALARRGRPSAALFLAITGGVTVWQYVTSTGRPLAEFESVWSVDHSYLDLYLVGGIVLLGVYWAATRRLTDLRTQVLLMVLVMTALIAHRDFLENPFDTFFGVAGVALFAFTVVFDLLAVGRWANIDSPALPRTSRLFAYLGFVLFSLVLVNWALVTNDLANVSFFTGQGALRGFQLIGQPMLYGVAVVALTLVVRGDDPLTDLEEVEGALTLFGAGAAPPPHPGMRPF